jgi:hypothetical protein
MKRAIEKEENVKEKTKIRGNFTFKRVKINGFKIKPEKMCED